MKLLSIKIPDPLFAEISREADSRKLSKSEVVRERLAASKGKRNVASLWDRMGDLVIRTDRLPTDLSSNKKHMKGYGANSSH